MHNRLGNYPPSHLKTMRDMANENVVNVLTAWGNPELSEEDMDTLKLVSLILVAMGPQRVGGA
jgi:hypothetical protein